MPAVCERVFGRLSGPWGAVPLLDSYHGAPVVLGLRRSRRGGGGGSVSLPDRGSSREPRPVLVQAGEASGLALALGLSQRGVPCDVVLLPHLLWGGHQPATVLDRPALEALNLLGVAEDVVAAGQPLSGCVVGTAVGRPVVTHLEPSCGRGLPAGVAICPQKLASVLYAHTFDRVVDHASELDWHQEPWLAVSSAGGGDGGRSGGRSRRGAPVRPVEWPSGAGARPHSLPADLEGPGRGWRQWAVAGARHDLVLSVGWVPDRSGEAAALPAEWRGLRGYFTAPLPARASVSDRITLGHRLLQDGRWYAGLLAWNATRMDQVDAELKPTASSPPSPAILGAAGVAGSKPDTQAHMTRPGSPTAPDGTMRGITRSRGAVDPRLPARDARPGREPWNPFSTPLRQGSLEVTFLRSPPRRYSLVFGADGGLDAPINPHIRGTTLQSLGSTVWETSRPRGGASGAGGGVGLDTPVNEAQYTNLYEPYTWGAHSFAPNTRTSKRHRTTVLLDRPVLHFYETISRFSRADEAALVVRHAWPTHVSDTETALAWLGEGAGSTAATTTAPPTPGRDRGCTRARGPAERPLGIALGLILPDQEVEISYLPLSGSQAQLSVAFVVTQHLGRAELRGILLARLQQVLEDARAALDPCLVEGLRGVRAAVSRPRSVFRHRLDATIVPLPRARALLPLSTYLLGGSGTFLPRTIWPAMPSHGLLEAVSAAAIVGQRHVRVAPSPSRSPPRPFPVVVGARARHLVAGLAVHRWLSRILMEVLVFERVDHAVSLRALALAQTQPRPDQILGDFGTNDPDPIPWWLARWVGRFLTPVYAPPVSPALVRPPSNVPTASPLRIPVLGRVLRALAAALRAWLDVAARIEGRYAWRAMVHELRLTRPGTLGVRPLSRKRQARPRRMRAWRLRIALLRTIQVLRAFLRGLMLQSQRL